MFTHTKSDSKRACGDKSLQVMEETKDDQLRQFQNEEELNEVCDFLNKKYNCQLYNSASFKTRGNRIIYITFLGCEKVDPVFTLLKLSNHQIINATIEEQPWFLLDEVFITECNFVAFRKLKDCWPADYKHADEILGKLDYDEIQSENGADTSPIILGSTIVNRQRWNEYWRHLNGSTGPKSGWKIPTPQQMCKVLGIGLFSLSTCPKTIFHGTTQELNEISDVFKTPEIR